MEFLDCRYLYLQVSVYITLACLKQNILSTTMYEKNLFQCESVFYMSDTLYENLKDSAQFIFQVWAHISMAWLTVKHTINDDRKGWLICMCVLIITVVRSGITYSFGMFVVDFEEIYHKPLAEQST